MAGTYAHTDHVRRHRDKHHVSGEPALIGVEDLKHIRPEQAAENDREDHRQKRYLTERQGDRDRPDRVCDEDQDDGNEKYLPVRPRPFDE